MFFTRSVAAPATNPPAYSAANEIVLKTLLFQHVDGKTFTLREVPISWTIGKLMKRLGEEKALEVEYYRFLWGGKPLRDGISDPCIAYEII